ncbi:ribose-phosphate pyrophosphokinase [Caenimonas terrae]|uniref:Ribose-phosphate pyrophosphokinase n=1 Tax=Caenimonas terrae TaxID=696074 RepID=A0ABW0NKC5_9BURK
MKLLVLALPGNGALAATLAGQLQCDWSELALHRFPDGETLVRIDAPVRGRCVVLAGSLHHPNENTLPMLFGADTARDLGASQVGLAAPYLAYLRQDRRFHAGEAITSLSYARLLSSSLDFLVTVDPHLHRWHSLDEVYPIRTQVVAAAPLIAQWLRANVADPLIVGPDAESGQWVAEVARLAGAPWTVLAKTRHGDREVRVRMPMPGPWPPATPVLVDDIISTGETLAAAAAALREAGLAAPLCIGVHALFDDSALARLLAAGVSRVVTCDTIAHPTNAIHVGAPLAQAVLALASAAASA